MSFEYWSDDINDVREVRDMQDRLLGEIVKTDRKRKRFVAFSYPVDGIRNKRVATISEGESFIVQNIQAEPITD